jgi:hypothetical protein
MTAVASKAYYRLIQPNIYARNGLVPESGFHARYVGNQNTVQAFRRKCFLSWSQWRRLYTDSVAGSVARLRVQMHTGYGAKRLRFKLGCGRDNSGAGLATDPRVSILIYDGVTSTTKEAHLGTTPATATGGAPDAPNDITWRSLSFDVDPATTYEIYIATVDYGRVLCVGGWEEASDIVDGSVDYMNDEVVTAGGIIVDSMRARTLQGLSQLWRRNGSHLLTYPGRGDGTGITTNSTTWKNALDTSITTVGSSTPGFYIGDNGAPSMEPWTRLSDGKVLDVVLAVYASTTAGSTGEVRLQDGSGTRCSITGIGSAADWYVTNTTISNTDTLAKLDLQARTSDATKTLTFHAASLYCYLA